MSKGFKRLFNYFDTWTIREVDNGHWWGRHVYAACEGGTCSVVDLK